MCFFPMLPSTLAFATSPYSHFFPPVLCAFDPWYQELKCRQGSSFAVCKTFIVNYGYRSVKVHAIYSTDCCCEKWWTSYSSVKKKKSYFSLFAWFLAFIILNLTGGFFGFFYMYCIQHCFICRPSDSTVSEDAGIEPRTVATSLAVRCSNH